MSRSSVLAEIASQDVTAAEVDKLDGLTATTAELNYTDGVTSALQTQMDTKALIANTNMTGTATAVNITMSGDLTVNGSTTTLDTTNTVIEDNLIGLNNGAGSNANDAGLIIERGSTGNDALFMWDESEDKWTLGTSTSTAASTGNLNMTVGTLGANLEGNVTGNVTVTTADINGGTVDGTVIGGASAAAGTFTTLASTGNTTIGDASGDIVTVNAGELIFANDTAFTLSGGVNGLNFDANTLSIDAADNRVGIGTAAPSSTMTLEFSHASEAATAGFTIRNTVNANNGIAPIYFGVSNERNKAAIGLKRATSYGVGDLIFAVDAVEGDTDVSFEDDEKMRITSSGNVSINSGQLNVKKGSFAQTHLTSSLILGY